MQVEFLLSPMILIALVLFVAWPLLTNRTEVAAVNPGDFEAALEEKEILVASLKDIEMDFRMGKLSEEDYQQLKKDFEERAIKSLQKLETLEKKSSRK